MSEGERDFAAMGAVQARYGLSMDFESIGRLIEEHGLGARGRSPERRATRCPVRIYVGRSTTSILVPLPGAERRLSRPSIASARSFMFSSP
ncbi:hypothetical protein BH09ACT13_BH09ACT13_12550 [soil metagenome]